MAITVNIYYSGKNGNAEKICNDCKRSGGCYFVQKKEIFDMNIFFHEG